MIPADLANSEPLSLLVIAVVSWLAYLLTIRRHP